jgi:hypothetical protein
MTSESWVGDANVRGSTDSSLLLDHVALYDAVEGRPV